MNIILLVLHVILSLGIITLVLLQKGSGASAGASFGGGAGSVFGASGSSNFLSKTTAIFAIGFFVNSLALAYLASHREMKTDSVLDALIAPVDEITAPEIMNTDDVPAPEAIMPFGVSVPAGTDASSGDDLPPPAGE